MAEFEQQLSLAESAEHPPKDFVDTVGALEKQVRQRLSMIDARIEFERRTFGEDVDDAVHDAGNAFELDLIDRLKTDKWKLAKVWESLGSSTFGKELKYRVDRIVSRREDLLRLLRDDLSLFQEDMRVSQTTILEKHHATHFAKAMPHLRVKTRIANAVDDTASVTLGASAFSLAGAGVATYMLGAAVVFPVIAPATPFVGGAMVLAGAIKWLQDPEGRKDGEIKDKRQRFEKELREQLAEAQKNFEFQLSEIALGFQRTAMIALEPMFLEAQAAERISAIQKASAKRVIEYSQASVSRLLAKVDSSAN